MNLIYLAGIVVGFGGIVFGYLEDGGVMASLVKISSLSIVFGGTFGIMLMANPLGNIKEIPAALQKVFFGRTPDYMSLIDTMCNYASTARREGMLVLEQEAEKSDNEFIKLGLGFIVDGIDPEDIEKILNSKIEEKTGRLEAAASVFENMGGTAPTMGVLGTVMGMVSILRDMSDMGELGAKIATAFIATMYGVGSANLLWLPLATHIKALTEKETLYYEIIVEGLLSIQAGNHPSLLKDSLYAKIGIVQTKSDGEKPAKAAGGPKG